MKNLSTMEADFPESPLDKELQGPNTKGIQDGCVKDVNSLQDLKLDREVQDQYNQDPESPQQDQEQQSLHSGLEQVQVQDKGSAQDEAEEHNKCPRGPPQDQLEVQGLDQNPTVGDDDRGRALGEESDHSPVMSHVWDPDLFRAGQSQDPGHRVDPDRASPQDQDRAERQDQDQDLTTVAANREAARESGGSFPALVITQAEESRRRAPAAPVGPTATPGPPAEPRRPQRPADLVLPVTPTGPGLSSSSDGGDMACSDLLSLRSDSLSLTSEPAIFRTSEEDDSRSVAASSVTSLFQRVQLDPLEKDWLRSSAVGNMAAQRHLLSQEPGLVMKKTALHWAAKQGGQEAVDMMLRFGADVNVRSGYTALHLASIHGHQHVIRALINTHGAKTNMRDYHGRTAAHYWGGCTDVFNKPHAQSGGRFYRASRTQRYALPSLLLSRSRSQEQLHLEFGTLPRSHDVSDLQV